MKKYYINFLQETEEELNYHEKNWKDVKKITHKEKELSLEQFKEIANKEYYPGYGLAVFDEFMIIGGDWWLERKEYDAKEEWVFRLSPFKDLNSDDTLITKIKNEIKRIDEELTSQKQDFDKFNKEIRELWKLKKENQLIDENRLEDLKITREHIKGIMGDNFTKKNILEWLIY